MTFILRACRLVGLAALRTAVVLAVNVDDVARDDHLTDGRLPGDPLSI